ncbi:MAG: hypothetical protein K2N87_12405 [Eubacterium sp.]|nr:hypothetical protein [Eubacterium sp.]
MAESNQIWAPYLAVVQQGGDLLALHYTVKNTRVSPYLEMQTDSLHGNGNYAQGQARLEVNPYVRFFSIFDPLLASEDLGYEAFEQALSDIMLHELADLDIKMGMCRHDFYIRLLIRDIEQGTFGGEQELAVFSVMEKRQAAEWLLSFYHTADASASLAGAVHAILPDCEIYMREGEEFVFYMRQPWEETEEKKLRFLIRLFLPLACSYTIHWTKTYGVIGYEDTMQMEDFVLA